MIASSRAIRTTERRSSSAAAPGRRRSHRGFITWFEIIVASAMDSTITIEVADENPPRKASIARVPFPSASGRVRTNMSGFAPTGIRSSPTTAMGTMNRLIAIMYSGKAQLARARCPSSSFSTTMT